MPVTVAARNSAPCAMASARRASSSRAGLSRPSRVRRIAPTASCTRGSASCRASRAISSAGYPSSRMWAASCRAASRLSGLVNTWTRPSRAWSSSTPDATSRSTSSIEVPSSHSSAGAPRRTFASVLAAANWASHGASCRRKRGLMANAPSRRARERSPAPTMPGEANGMMWLGTRCPAFAADDPSRGAPMSRTVTSAPRRASDDATDAPMMPAPITTTRLTSGPSTTLSWSRSTARGSPAPCRGPRTRTACSRRTGL